MNKLITFILLGCFIPSTYALTDTSTPLSGFALYKQRVNTVCKIHKPQQVMYQTQEYFDFTGEDPETISTNNDFRNAKLNYKNNMSNIYKCALIGVQKKSISLVQEDLLRAAPLISNKVKNKLQSKQSATDLISKNIKCRDNSSDKDSLQKLRVLQQTTYELCKYHSYLEYIKERNYGIINAIDSSVEESYDIGNVVDAINKKQNDIENEILRSYKIFPIAFQAYSEYENNYTIHILLELLQDDYIVFKEKLHGVVNPINQVVYKISNAMKLD